MVLDFDGYLASHPDLTILKGICRDSFGDNLVVLDFEGYDPKKYPILADFEGYSQGFLWGKFNGTRF